jgi:hypothetical protein
MIYFIPTIIYDKNMSQLTNNYYNLILNLSDFSFFRANCSVNIENILFMYGA